MPDVTASAPGKIILFGEHAVVYDRPALAIPLSTVRAWATVNEEPANRGLRITALDLDIELSLAETAAHGLTMMAQLVLDHCKLSEPDASIQVKSEIPIAAGLGSGAAVAAALGRALGTYLNHSLAPADLSTLVYEVEKYYHGTPSGIDNTVICYEKPVYFVRGRTPEVFEVSNRLDLLVGDTGIPSPTKETVGRVRQLWTNNTAHIESIFDQIKDIAQLARKALSEDQPKVLGTLMNENHELLKALSVSSTELNHLVNIAVDRGALGAKMSGGGGGGNMIALVEPDRLAHVKDSLLAAGAVNVHQTTLSKQA